MPLNDLNQNELEAMRILWEEGPLKPSDIQSRFGWPIENATLRSVLVQLVDKGHIQREPEGKAFLYRAQVAKATLLQSMMQSLARFFAGGSPRELVAQLVETGDLKPRDIALLHRTASEKGTAAPHNKRKRA
jgi:predicted transcriptional regulator